MVLSNAAMYESYTEFVNWVFPSVTAKFSNFFVIWTYSREYRCSRLFNQMHDPSRCLDHLLPVSLTPPNAGVATRLDGRFRLPKCRTERFENTKTFPSCKLYFSVYRIRNCFKLFLNVFTLFSPRAANKRILSFYL